MAKSLWLNITFNVRSVPNSLLCKCRRKVKELTNLHIGGSSLKHTRGELFVQVLKKRPVGFECDVTTSFS